MMSGSMLPQVGTRLNHAGYLGTVRFVGQVDGAQGTWLGVEWDDPKRGKHDGVKDNKRYFTCLVPNAGSFIRPSASISYGTSFLKAMSAKYVESLRGCSTMEKVVLGSSNGAIEVEAVNLDKIRAKLSHLESLRQVSLDDQNVATSDQPGDIKRTCPNIRGLDLSKNLLPSWDMVAMISSELEHLERLALNQNRLTLPANVSQFVSAFLNLQELQINATLTRWHEMRIITSSMPKLRLIETGYNRIRHLDIPDELKGQLPNNDSIQTINLDCNELTKWADICRALQPFTSLQRLILSSNAIDTIDSISSQSPLQSLKHLALSFNALKIWSDVDELSLWCPLLESLKLAGNPIVEDLVLGKNARQFTIAKIPTLLTLDGAEISPRERTDSELFYLSYINKSGPAEEDAKCREHPRWIELCSKHGRPEGPTLLSHQKQNTLRNRLFQVNIRKYTQADEDQRNLSAEQDLVEPSTLRVLPTMSVRTFRLKVIKSFKIPKAQQSSVRLWLKMPNNNITELDSDHDTYDLSWWGLEDGTEILLYVAPAN